jgi:hypothetical protein
MKYNLFFFLDDADTKTKKMDANTEKLGKKEDGHQRWAATQIFQIRFFLVYLGLFKGQI